MLRLAIAGRAAWEISTIELDRGGQSYTVDTLRELKSRAPEADLLLLLGADALADLPQWREPAIICDLATPLAVRRSGSPEPNYDALAPFVSSARLAEIRAQRVDMPATPISSSEIQQMIVDRGAWQLLMPAPVAAYIVDRGLYGAALIPR
jgi:nicotinate-nucleotide adenylyltransferase